MSKKMSKPRNRPRTTHHPNMRLLLAIAGLGFLVFGAVTMLGPVGKAATEFSPIALRE
jgi:hypothetical protein